MGSVDSPANACAFALGCNARFVARGIDMLIIDAAALMQVGSKAFMEARP